MRLASSVPRTAALAAIALASAGVARADDATDVPAATVARTEPVRRHAVYVDVLGKGGLWGVGYDVQLAPRFGAGAAASYSIVDGQRVTSVSPYVSATLVGRGRHRWFAHAGPQWVRVTTPSPVPEWPGARDTGIGFELSSGYEYRNHVLVRVYGVGVAGKHGVAPWLGASIGWTL